MLPRPIDDRIEFSAALIGFALTLIGFVYSLRAINVHRTRRRNWISLASLVLGSLLLAVFLPLSRVCLAYWLRLPIMD